MSGDVNVANPYQAPRAAPVENEEALLHGISVRKETWRGAKFGAKWTALVLGTMVVVLWLAGLVFLAVFLTQQDSSFRANLAGRWPQIALEALWAVGRSIVVVALVSIYGAIAGAFVMGLGALVRKLLPR